ncbi:helix-turn-helix domain-containing protein [Paenibacillus sp. D51F]
MSYSLLSLIERGQIEALYRLGWSFRKISHELGRHPFTIACQLKLGRQQNAISLSPPSRRTMSGEL